MGIAVPVVVGVGLALAIVALSRLSGLDRDRALYPTMLIVIASYYALFAVMGDSTSSLLIESIVVTAFAIAAIIGFRTSLWIVAAGLAAHGIFDFFHAGLIVNPGVPVWWPSFCLAFDVTIAICLAWLLRQGRWRGRARAGSS